MSRGSKLIFILDDKLPTVQALSGLDVFLYAVRQLPEHNWIRVNNLHNGMDDEFKTTSIIGKHAIHKTEKVDLHAWLKMKDVEIRHKSSAMNW
ncbi:hypothetical protein D3C86_2057500 [compost metagenome]